MGLTLEQITSVQADATALPFEKEFFDAVVSTDSFLKTHKTAVPQKLIPHDLLLMTYKITLRQSKAHLRVMGPLVDYICVSHISAHL